MSSDMAGKLRIEDQRVVATFPSKSFSDTRAADIELAGRLREGDVTAYEDLYRRHGSRIYNLAYRMLGSGADAEDLLQETFLQVFRRIDGFKGDAALGTWMYRLAMNLCLDRLRSKAGKADRQTSSVEDIRQWRLPAAGPIDGSVSRIDLERAIAQLPDACRAAFLLHDVEGFEHQEVGRMLGVSDGTSKSQVHKARLRIRAYLLGDGRRPSKPVESGQSS
jgi:RNA polymerase sigma-70 factor (ECF subfamily)